MLKSLKTVIGKRIGRVHANGAATPPSNTVLPLITGSTAGEVCSTSDGTWGGSPASFTYQWYLDGGILNGETADEITTDETWVDSTLTVKVTAYNAGGSCVATSLGVVLT